MNDPWAELDDLFPLLRSRGSLAKLQQHAALVEHFNTRLNLTRVTGEDAILRHYGESLELWRIAGKAAGQVGTLTDIGSGAGYPGLVIAAVEPDLRVALIEPRRKRAAAIEELAAAMELPNVEVHPVRAEEAGRGPLRGAAGLVTARAVAALPVLLEYAAPLAREGGCLAFPKGSGLDGEIAGAAAAAGALGCALEDVVAMRPAISATIRVARYRQERTAPEAYPRRPGVPERRPLGDHRGPRERRDET